MTALFSGHDIIYLTGGRIAEGRLTEEKGPICTDIRKLKGGEWFLAWANDHEDTHDYIGEAMSRGALGCIVENRTRYAFAGKAPNLIAVSDTIKAYHEIARAWRIWTKPRVIAIAQSSRQTHVKQFCRTVFRGLRTYESTHAISDEIDIADTILEEPEHTQLLLLEMQSSHRGVLSSLAYMARPDIAVIAYDPDSSAESIKIKCELLENLDEETGIAVIVSENSELIGRARNVYSGKMHVLAPSELKQKVRQQADGTVSFELNGAESPLSIATKDTSEVLDAWCAITCGRELGLMDELIAQSLQPAL